jgi:hypothetical protein
MEDAVCRAERRNKKMHDKYRILYKKKGRDFPSLSFFACCSRSPHFRPLDALLLLLLLLFSPFTLSHDPHFLLKVCLSFLRHFVVEERMHITTKTTTKTMMPTRTLKNALEICRRKYYCRNAYCRNSLGHCSSGPPVDGTRPTTARRPTTSLRTTRTRWGELRTPVKDKQVKRKNMI